MLLMLSGMLFANTPAQDVKWGVGMGVNYGGGVGVQASMPMNEQIDAFVALGALVGIGYTVGVQYKIDEHIRATFNYGTNAYVETCPSYPCPGSSTYKLFSGLNLGAEYLWDNGFHLDLMYIDSSSAQDFQQEEIARGAVYEEELVGGIRLSFGYNF